MNSFLLQQDSIEQQLQIMRIFLSLPFLLLQHTTTVASGFSHPSLLLRSNNRQAWNTNFRGGATAAARATSDESDNGDEAEVELVTSKFADISAENAKRMSNYSMDEESRRQQSKSYFLSAALWSSLALDTVLNKKKRSLIIPGVKEIGGRVAGSNLAVTASLTSGFLLSAGLAFFLSKDLNRVGSWDEELKIEAMRKRIHLLLFSYGTFNLCSNINPASAPFFGLGGFVINAHNALIALNGWIKESSSSAMIGIKPDSTIKDLFKTIVSMPKSLFRTADVTMGFRVRTMSSLYMACGVIAGLRSFDIISNSLVPHYMACYASRSFSAAPLSQLQLIGLKWAALSRTILAGGTCVLVKDQMDNGRLKENSTRTLEQIISVCALLGKSGLSNSNELIDLLHFKIVISCYSC